MANTTFNGPVRSENGFVDIVKDSLGNVITNMKLEQYTATVTVASGDTTATESAIGMPTNFIPMACTVVVTTAATNAVNLDDVGSDADTVSADSAKKSGSAIEPGLAVTTFDPDKNDNLLRKNSTLFIV